MLRVAVGVMDEVSSGGTEGLSQQLESLKLSESRRILWRPRALAFSAYSPAVDSIAKPRPLRAGRRPLVNRLTKDVVELYQTCNPQFRYSDELNLKRFLTSPSTGLSNDGCDNANSDLILNVNYVLVNSDTKQRYIVKDILGQGTFGQVAKCWVAETESFVAVKIIKNLPAYHQQALVEVSILTTVNKKFDPEDNHHIVRIYDYFVFQRHLCIVCELLDMNLYELIKLNHFRGLSLSFVQLFSKQILLGLTLMKEAGIIHCDLKPENILLCPSVKPAEIKIIDFGSACMEERTVYSYIQSRYYRSPEVLLGYQYTTAIDMWSYGCIVAELFLGLPLFPGASEFDLLRRMNKILGRQPPDYILHKAKSSSKFFKFTGSLTYEDGGQKPTSNCSMYQVLTEEEYATRESKKPSIGKEYFNHSNLETIVAKYPYKKNLTEEDIAKERQIRSALVDFLRGLIEFDPEKRWSPLQASKHPFITGEPFTCKYEPAPETPRVHVSQKHRVDHHPSGGHWFAAGLSPNITVNNRAVRQSSPHYQLMPFGSNSNYNNTLYLGSSYGSYGDSSNFRPSSYGSYGDSNNFRPSSYGSYGDSNNFHAFYSPNLYAQSGMSLLGNSPDTRQQRLMHGNNMIGFSPGNFAPMSLGSSPSQFTPISPGHYGPPSPVRVNGQGSPLGKVASGSQYSRRNNMWPNVQFQENVSSSSHSHFEANSASGGSPSHWQTNSSESTQQRGRSMNSGYPSSHYKGNQASTSLPDPGDWDPNYSDELLLEGDSSDISITGTQLNGMNLNQPQISSEPFIGVPRSNRILNASNQTNPSHLMPHSLQKSPSHNMGRQPIQRPYQGRFGSFRGSDQWSHQAPQSRK